MGQVKHIEVKPGLKPERTHEDGIAVVKKDKIAVLIVNKSGQFKFLPRWMVAELSAKFEVLELTAADPDYLDAYKKALGFWEDHGPEETIQMNGKFIKPESLGAINIADLLKKAEEEVKAGKDKEGKLVVTDKMPGGSDAFKARIQEKRFER